jgi:hypothetical protein
METRVPDPRSYLHLFIVTAVILLVLKFGDFVFLECHELFYDKFIIISCT